MAKKKVIQESPFIGCTVKSLPENKLIAAAEEARQINPANGPPVHAMAQLADPSPANIAMLTDKYWGPSGVNLGVYFFDTTDTKLIDKIVSHMNAWGKSANVTFTVKNKANSAVRIAFKAGDGYWSYLGTDILQIISNKPTMNLDSFSLDTPDSEFYRVVRHETGHTLGCPHEHLRKEIIGRLDPAKTVAFFKSNYGWSEAMTKSNVLTPLEDRSIIATPVADEVSIMTYQLPGEITKDGKPIKGGTDIDDMDYTFMASRYPKPTPPPPPPTSDRWKVIIESVGTKPFVSVE